MGNLVWALVAALVFGLCWLVWEDGHAAPGQYLFAQRDALAEAGYCLAAVEQAQQMGVTDPGLAAFLGESHAFWQTRTKGQGTAGGMAFVNGLPARTADLTAHVKSVLHACSTRAVALYGQHFHSLDPGDGLS